MESDFVVISYGDSQRYYNDMENMKPFVDRINRSFIAYDRNWLVETDTYKNNKIIFDNPKLGGWCAWKPIIMLDALEKYERVLYMDANTIFRSGYDIPSIVNSVEIISAVKTSFRHSEYTHTKCFELMGCTGVKYLNADQVWAGVTIASRKAIDIIKEWLKWCCVSEVICSEKQDTNHHHHRHDQSILTNLLIKYDLLSIETSAFHDNQNFRNDKITGKQL